MRKIRPVPSWLMTPTRNAAEADPPIAFRMRLTGKLKEWLPWIIKIHFMIITFVFAIEFTLRQVLFTSADPDPPHILEDSDRRLVCPGPFLSDLQPSQHRLLFAGLPVNLFRYPLSCLHQSFHERPGQQLCFLIFNRYPDVD